MYVCVCVCVCVYVCIYRAYRYHKRPPTWQKSLLYDKRALLYGKRDQLVLGRIDSVAKESVCVLSESRVPQAG